MKYEITDLTAERTELTKAEKARLAGENWTAEIKRCKCEKHGYFDTAVYYENKRIVGPAIYCTACFMSELAAENKAFLSAAERAKAEANQQGVPERFKSADLDEMDLDSEIRGALDSFCDGNIRNLILAGDVGTGKTHSACAAAHVFALRGESVMYVTEHDLMTRLKSGIASSTDTSDFMKRLYTCALLIIDEAGDTASSEYKKDVIKDIVDKRWSNSRRQMIVVSNLDGQSLAAELGKAAIDRLMDCGRVLVYRGKSRRGELEY